MGRKVTAIALAILAMAIFARTAAAEPAAPLKPNFGREAQQCSGQIFGFVKLDTGSAVDGASVVVKPEGGGSVPTTTNGIGQFTVNAPQGAYSVELSVPTGFDPLTPTTVLVNLTDAQCKTVQVDFQLKLNGQPRPSPVPGPANIGGISLSNLPNPLDEVRKLLPKTLELPVKEMMFLGGNLAGPIGSLFSCLNIFGYIFAVGYCWAAVQWLINCKGDFSRFMEDFLAGPAGKQLFVVSVIAAPMVYLVSFHNIAMALWVTSNSYLQEALGWNALNFSADLDPESLLELLKWIPVWASLHMIWEVILFFLFMCCVLLSGLMKSVAPLRAWAVGWAGFALYGIGVWFVTISVDWVRSMGIVGNNVPWSSFVRINKMFVGGTQWLMVIVVGASLIYAVKELWSATHKESQRETRPHVGWSTEDLLNILQTLGIYLAITRPSTTPAGAWPGYPPNYSRLGQRGTPQRPSGDDDDLPLIGLPTGNPKGPSSQPGNSTKPGGQTGLPSTKDPKGSSVSVGQKPPSDVEDAVFRSLDQADQKKGKPEGTSTKHPTDESDLTGQRGISPTDGKEAKDSLPEDGTRVETVEAELPSRVLTSSGEQHPTASRTQSGDETAARLRSRMEIPLENETTLPAAVSREGSAVNSIGDHVAQTSSQAALPQADEKESSEGASQSGAGDGANSFAPQRNAVQVRGDEKELPREQSSREKVAPQSPAAKQGETGVPLPTHARRPKFHMVRMKEKVEVQGTSFEAGEPVLVANKDGKMVTADGCEIPADKIEPIGGDG